MRIPIKYIASSGHEYNLISDGIKHKEANYWDWKYTAEGTKLQYGFRVADFSKDAKTYKTTLLFYGSELQRRQLLSALHDDFENDIRQKKPGKLMWGSYYLMCYVLESSTQPTEALTQTINEISIYSPYPFWLQDFNIEFPKQTAVVSEYLDYKYGYEYDFKIPPTGQRSIARTFPFDSDFKMTIFGAAVNPRVTINGYTYLLYMTINDGEYVVIDSKAKTIILHDANGQQSSVFDARNKAATVFQKIPGGNLDVVWDSSFGVNLTIYQERSEPRIEVSA